MRACRFFALTLLLIAAAGLAMGQVVGMGTTKRGFTNQAGAAISKIVSQHTEYNMRAQTFGGSSVYVPAVSAGQLEFGLANELETTFAVSGTGIYDGRPQDNLRVVSVLIPFRVAIFVREDSPIQTLADLKGKRVPSGWASQKIIGVLMDGYLANAGLTYDDVVQVPVPNVVGGANDFAAGNADAFFFVFGAGKVKETAAKVGGIRVLGVSEDPAAVERMREHVPPAYALEVRPSKSNVGVDKPLNVMAYDYLMLTNSQVDGDMVYTITKTLHDMPGELAKAFPALRLFSPDRMTKSLDGISYHPGAIRYYREIGAWPPQ